MINEIRAQFHKMITEAIRKREMNLKGVDIKKYASELSSVLATKLADPKISIEERNKAANSLVAISTVENDLDGYC